MLRCPFTCTPSFRSSCTQRHTVERDIPVFARNARTADHNRGVLRQQRSEALPAVGRLFLVKRVIGAFGPGPVIPPVLAYFHWTLSTSRRKPPHGPQCISSSRRKKISPGLRISANIRQS